ncbi:MAG: hypothetical protein J5742_04565 [Alphaproteobacteria bacterium]|nr:hypothetical protein [Alphaproteobacteria bacterium]
MKKKFLYGLVASISVFSIDAYADPVADASSSAVTTKGYVDTGLKYVYDAIKGEVSNVKSDVNDVKGDVTNLQNAVGTAHVGDTPGTGLTGTVESLQNTIGDANSGLIQKVNSLESASKTYNAGTGIVVTPGATTDAPSTIGLDVTTSANTTYVFKTDAQGNGTWQALEVESSWDPGFLTNP